MSRHKSHSNGPTHQQMRLVDQLISTYEEKHEIIERFLGMVYGAISGSQQLAPYIHSLKKRMKLSDHLRDKLNRKIIKCNEDKKSFDITPENLLVKINDLAGMRVLHLHTKQIENIDPFLKNLMSEQTWEIQGRPSARTWDKESEDYFSSLGFVNVSSKTLYTSIHYVIASATRTKITCEIQVRTLMEEVWGEVDHTLNYPSPTPCFSCAEQLKALARATSSASRLVDSIFASHDHFLKEKENASAGASVSGVPKKRVHNLSELKRR